MKTPEFGPVLTCPNDSEPGPPHGACRIGSPYYIQNLGRCHRCDEVLVADVDLSRVMLRNRLYEERR